MGHHDLMKYLDMHTSPTWR